MATINTNMAANIASNSMTRNERAMSATMERLSTGLRINSAKDDAAGLAISSKMTSQIRGLNQAVRNANDAISMIQVAEGAMKEVTNMFQRMRELAVQAISDSNTSADRVALNNEYQQLSDEVQRVAENTQWNGTNILDGGQTATTFQVGANASQTIDVNFGDLATNDTSMTSHQVTFKTAVTDANVAAIDGNFVISDGTNSLTLSASDIGATKTVDALITKITGDTAEYGNLGFTVSGSSSSNTLIFTMKATDGTGSAPTIAMDDGGTNLAAAVARSGAVLTFSAEPTATDTITYKVGDGSSENYAQYKGALSTGAINVVEKDNSGSVDSTELTTSATWSDSDKTLTIVGTTATISDVSVSRGTHAPVAATDITSSAFANSALSVLSDAIDGVNSTRAGLGASMSRLEYASDNLQNVAQNTSAARSRVLDADYAAETTELARTQIIQQAATAMLAQANQSQQAVLSLLKS